MKGTVSVRRIVTGIMVVQFILSMAATLDASIEDWFRLSRNVSHYFVGHNSHIWYVETRKGNQVHHHNQ